MRTTAAARTYFTTAGNAYITNNFGAQTTQTIAAYNFMADLVADVINIGMTPLIEALRFKFNSD
jgi:hypothetical protein